MECKCVGEWRDDNGRMAATPHVLWKLKDRFPGAKLRRLDDVNVSCTNVPVHIHWKNGVIVGGSANTQCLLLVYPGCICPTPNRRIAQQRSSPTHVPWNVERESSAHQQYLEATEDPGISCSPTFSSIWWGPGKLESWCFFIHHGLPEFVVQTQVFISYVIRAACPPKDPLIHKRVCHRGACRNQLEDKVIIQNAATCPDDHSCVARLLLVDPRLMGCSSKPQWLPWSIVMDLTPQETSLGHDNMPCPKQISLANTFFQVFFSFQGVYIDVISRLVGVTWVIDCTIVYHLLIKGIA